MSCKIVCESSTYTQSIMLFYQLASNLNSSSSTASLPSIRVQLFKSLLVLESAQSPYVLLISRHVEYYTGNSAGSSTNLTSILTELEWVYEPTLFDFKI